VKCIVGLGNPGGEYRSTRHNIGFRVVDALAERMNVLPRQENELFAWYTAPTESGNLVLLFPQTYMNNSGAAVLAAMEQFSVLHDEILVTVDDFQLPFGTLRMREKGSDGGHNGLASIIYHLQSDLFPRLRIGVAGETMPERHTHDAMADYVLDRFSAAEEKVLPQLTGHAADAILCWIEHGIAKTMSQFNRNFFTSGDAPERVL
jgi:PTH1 family peptidyl-tRNA hydrolase